jgi:ligand-binding sensor protein
MELTQILSLDEWKEIESDLFKTYSLQGSVFNTEGVRITDLKLWANQLCPAIKSIDKGQSFICAVAHMNLSNQARQTRKPVIEECDAGLLKIVVPVFVGDEYLGVVGGCGLIANDGEVDNFAVNKITDMDDTKIQALSTGIPTMTLEEAQAVCDYIEDRLNTILSKYKNPDH